MSMVEGDKSRIGEFCVHDSWIRSPGGPERMLDILRGSVIVRCEHHWDARMFKYTAFNLSFEPVFRARAPRHTLFVNDGDVIHSWCWKLVGDNFAPWMMSSEDAPPGMRSVELEYRA